MQTAADKRRAVVVEAVAAILDKGEPTRFAYEGACRHGVRGAFILCAGMPWRAADTAAADIIESAFRRLGVSRPRWIEGQPEAVEPVVERLTCIACGGEIGETRNRNGGERRYCSAECRVAFLSRMRRRDEERATRAEWLAKQAAIKDANRPMRDCQECGKPYRPNAGTRPGKFCSRECAGKNVNRRRITRPERPCERCGVIFKPKAQGRRFCSYACSLEARRAGKG